MPSAL